MRWRVLGALLGAILLGALLFSRWQGSDLPPAPQPIADVLPVVPRPVDSVLPQPKVDPGRAPVVAVPQPPAPPSPAAPVALVLDEEPDFEHLRALGLGPEDVEPRDAGPLHALTREGIKAAVTSELPEIRECYEGWLQQNPALGGKLKVQFTIVEIPGRDRAKIMNVDIADGGMGHVAMEGCVRNVFKGMRFERPEHGEMRVTYPLAFEPGSK